MFTPKNATVVKENEVIIKTAQGTFSLGMVDDTIAAQIESIVNGSINMSAIQSTPTTVAPAPSAPVEKSKKQYKYATVDVTIGMTVDKRTVKLNEYAGKAVWKILQERYEAVGATYDKQTRSITFKNQKDATAFAKNATVTVDEQNRIIKGWNEGK